MATAAILQGMGEHPFESPIIKASLNFCWAYVTNVGCGEGGLFWEMGEGSMDQHSPTIGRSLTLSWWGVGSTHWKGRSNKGTAVAGWEK